MTDIALSRLIEMLILPPGGPLLLILLAALLWRGRFKAWGRGLLLTAVLSLYLLSTPWLAHLLAQGLQPAAPLAETQLQADVADAIVVLAGPDAYLDAPEYGGDTAGPQMLTRLRYAAHLQRQSGLPLVVVGGDGLGRGVPAAVYMRQILTEEFGVPVVGGDGRSRHTFDNARYAREVLTELNGDTVLLVTHGWHMRRAQAAFEAEGLTVIPAATAWAHEDQLSAGVYGLIPRPWAMDVSYWALREWLVLVVVFR